MKKLSLLFLCILVLTLLVSCKSESNLFDEDDIDKYEIDIKMESEFAHDFVAGSGRFWGDYLYPGETFEVDFEIDGSGTTPLDKDKTLVWTFKQVSGGSFFKEYVYPQGRATSVEESFDKEGGYTIRVDLYESEEYGLMGVAAPRIGTVEQDIMVEGIKFEVETEVIGERTIKFTPKILNPEIGPVYTGLRLSADGSPLKQIDGRNVESITHEFDKEGKYDIKIELLYQVKIDHLVIAESHISVNIAKNFEIIVPEGPINARTECTFKVLTSGSLPSSPVYEWDFGDGKGLVIPFSNEVVHLYEEPGHYTIKVLIIESDDENAPLLGEASMDITVEPGDLNVLDFLQNTNHLAVYVRGDTTYHESDGYTSPANGCVFSVYYAESRTTWDENHFTNRYFSAPTDFSSGIDINIEGDISEKGDIVSNIAASITYDDSHRLTGEKREIRISIVNVELVSSSTLPEAYDPSRELCFVAYVEGPDVSKHVTSTFYNHLQPKTSDPDFRLWYDSLQLTNTQFTPYLLVVFKNDRIDAYDDPGYNHRD